MQLWCRTAAARIRRVTEERQQAVGEIRAVAGSSRGVRRSKFAKKKSKERGDKEQH